MGFRIFLAEFHAGELGHDAVADVGGIFSLVGILVGHDAEFHHLGIGAVVEPEKVGAGFFERALVLAERSRGNPREKLAAAVPKTFVEVGVYLVHSVAELLCELDFRLVPGELGEHAVGLLEGCRVVCVGDVCDGDALGSVFLANPVRVGEVDSDGRGRIGRSSEGHGVDHLRADALAFTLAETRVDGGVILEPLGVRAQDFGALGGGCILDVDKSFPGSLAAERVVVIFDETVNIVDCAEGVAHPLDIVFVPGAEVSAAVVGHELVDG